MTSPEFEQIERLAEAQERQAEALEVQNALLLELIHQQNRTLARQHPDPEKRPPSDAAVATDVVDKYGDLYGGTIAGWEFDPIADRVEDMGE